MAPIKIFKKVVRH